MSVTNNSSFQNKPFLDNQTIWPDNYRRGSLKTTNHCNLQNILGKIKMRFAFPITFKLITWAWKSVSDIMACSAQYRWIKCNYQHTLTIKPHYFPALDVTMGQRSLPMGYLFLDHEPDHMVCCNLWVYNSPQFARWHDLQKDKLRLPIPHHFPAAKRTCWWFFCPQPC